MPLAKPNEERSLAEVWAKYEAKVIPHTAGEGQRRDVKNAFYAGAHTIWSIIMRNASDGDQITEADEALMASLDGELQAFMTETLARAAASAQRRGRSA